MNIVERIRRENAGRLNGIAVEDGSRRWTYGEVIDKTERFREAFKAQGVRPKTRIAFRCEDGLDYIAGSLALLDAGAAIVPVATSLPEAEISETLERIDVHGFVFQPGGLAADPEDVALEDVDPDVRFQWRAREPRNIAPEACRNLDAAFIRFSSGTTGASKGVVLCHDSIYDRTQAADEGLHVTENDRILWVLSMSHHFVVSILLFLRKGATIVIGHRTFPASVVEAAAAGGITFIYASPVHYALLAGAEDVPADSLRRVRIAISTAMKLPDATAEAFARKFGFELTEAYGIIEVGLPFINLNAGDRCRGSVGKMLPAYELRLEHPDSQGNGEVLIRGKGMFDAYFSPWQLRKDALEDGWFRTGDLGRLDDDGNLEIVGRSKTVIVFAGLKVFPTEVEEVLNAHPAVKESLVSGVEHATYGQIPEARIVPVEPEARPDDLIPSLRKHCYERLSAFKVPKSFKLVNSLPRTASGKLVRR